MVLMLTSNLKVLRKARGFTQVDMADAINVETKRYAKWEEGRAEPPTVILLELSRVFSITINELLEVDFSSPASIEIKEA